MRSYFLMLSLVFLLSGCQTPPVRQFSQVHNGMEKTEVLDIMGTPWTTTRLHGKDRWIYVIYDNDVRQEREVHFLNGRVVYVGGEWKPESEKTAESVDKKNDQLDKQFKEESEKAKIESKEAFPSYEKQVKGEGKKVKYMPEYQEIK